jgi:preprotein translocase subunit SecG
MYTLITALAIIICILLILIVLVQNSKGGGLASGFTGSQVMGVRKTADFLEKSTWTLAGGLLFLCILANIVLPRQQETQQKSLMQDEIQNAIDPNVAPKFPTSAPVKEDANKNEVPIPDKKEKK